MCRSHLTTIRTHLAPWARCLLAAVVLVGVLGGSSARVGAVLSPRPTARPSAQTVPGWTNITGTSPLPPQMTAQAVTEGRDGKIYLFGGSSCVTPGGPCTLYNTTYIFDPATGQWRQGTPMPAARKWGRAVTLPDGRIFVIGGQDLTDVAINAPEIYTPSTDSWTWAPLSPTTRYGGVAALGGDGRVYFMSGTSVDYACTVDAYDLATRTWAPAAPLPQCDEVGVGAATMAPNGDIVATIGSSLSTYIYHPATNTWTPAANLPEYGDPQVAGPAPGGLLYFAGLLRTYRYDPAADTWTVFATVPAPRLDALLPAPNGQVYDVGDESQATSQIYRGTPQPVPHITVNPAALAFGVVQDGATSPAQSITVTNSGSSALTVGPIALTGANAAAFRITDTCQAAPLEPAATCTIAVSVAPTTTGALAATVTISSDAVNGAQTVALSGTGGPAPTLTLTTTRGPVGQTIAVSGTNFGVSEPIGLFWDSLASSPLTTTQSSAAGIFSARIIIPHAVYGAHALIAVGQTSGLSGTVLFRVQPHLRAQPALAVPGARVALSGDGYAADETVAAYWWRGGGLLGTTTTDAQGSFDGPDALTATVPLSASGGDVVYGLGEQSHALALTIVGVLTPVASATATPSSVGTLTPTTTGTRPPTSTTTPVPTNTPTPTPTPGFPHTATATAAARSATPTTYPATDTPTMTPTPALTFVPSATPPPTATACASTASTWAWGDDSVGQLGNGSLNSSAVPVLVRGLCGVTALSSGAVHTLAVRSDGTVWGWGQNVYGNLGDTAADVYVDVPVQISGLSNIIAVAAGYWHSLALRADGTVWAFGNNLDGQLGSALVPTSSVTQSYSMAPVQVQGLPPVIAIAAGKEHSLALAADGSVWAWGANEWGELGTGTTESCLGTPCSSLPVRVWGLTGVVAIAAGDAHSLAVRADGTAWAWGSNSYGQLGDGRPLPSWIPVQVLGLHNVTTVAGGYNVSLARTADGRVWAWGWNAYGELGDGSTADSPLPVRVQSVSNVVALASTGADGTHALAIEADGSVWRWGEDFTGTVRVPVQVAGIAHAVAIAAGGQFSVVAENPTGTLALAPHLLSDQKGTQRPYGSERAKTPLTALLSRK